jgi:hypothetical protein
VELALVMLEGVDPFESFLACPPVTRR